MATTQEQIDSMREMCEAMAKADLVQDATVDDWGRFGNFQILLTPSNHDRFTTNRLKALVRKYLPNGAMLRAIFGPDPIYETYWPGCRKVKGYERDFWVVDIDYQEYHAATNTFGRLKAA